jgi:hypothetical protein
MILRRLICAALLLTTSSTAFAQAPNFLTKILGKRGVEADSNKAYDLTVEDGPWMILAANFAGENSKSQAEKLVLEIRRDLRLPAFIHHERFDFTGKVSKRAELAEKHRYANQYQYEAYAVLVGEYDTVEHPSIDRDLAAIKVAKPTVFAEADTDNAEASADSPIPALKAVKNLIYRKTDKIKGPMAGAFVTRNPMLPEDYFDSPQVDSFVRELNEDKPYNLLKCDGKFTVVVKTFEGMGKLVSGHDQGEFEPSIERLDKMAASADKMVQELRSQGKEAYQFHDRNRSLVTIGSFDTLGRELPDGGFEYDPAIRAVMNEYNALNSEKAYAINGKGVAAHHVAMIPFDVKPTPIAVPKATKLNWSALGKR